MSFFEKVREELIRLKIDNHCTNEKKILRECFIRSAFIYDPEKAYHLEIIAQDCEEATKLNDIMHTCGIHSKTIKRQNRYIVYIKDASSICDFLNITGAHISLMAFENVRIMKEMRNSVNRAVNCDTANLEKTVSMSMRQIENIKYIDEKFGLDTLPSKLKQIAKLRLTYPDAALLELGELLDPKLGKSGVSHRLRKIDKIADYIRHNNTFPEQ